jgi:outer membrane protein assembly factor BamB
LLVTRRPSCPIIVAAVLALAAWRAAYAQGRGGPNWTTTGGDAQRTASVRTDPRISKSTVRGPAFQLLWKAKLDNQVRQLESLTQPMLLSNIISYKGFKALAFVGGSSDNVYSIDYDLNRLFWKRHLNAPSPPSGSLSCPGALTTITRATPMTQIPAGAPTAPPAATPSGASPGRGAPPAPAGSRGAGPGAPPAPAGSGGGGRGADLNVYVVSSNGMAYTLNPQTGDDIKAPVKFLPPNAKAIGSILVDTTLYAATADNCGGAANGVWAIDLGSDAKPVRTWATNGGSVAGTAGPAVATNGSISVATGDGAYSSSTYSDAVVALDPLTLALKGWFTPGRTAFTASPVAFEFHGRDLIVAANSDGRLYVLDAASPGGADHQTPLSKTLSYAASSAGFAAGALATWEDQAGTRWVLAPAGGPLHADAKFPLTNGPVTNGAIVAYTVVEENGTPALKPSWVSRDMVSPVPATIVNGVVFALSSGEYRGADAQMSAAKRAQLSKPAVLYALDAATGKDLWTSGAAITSFVHAVGPSAGDGQVYVVTYDGTVYAFGIPIEH